MGNRVWKMGMGIQMKNCTKKLHKQRWDDLKLVESLFTNIFTEDSGLTAMLFMKKEHNNQLSFTYLCPLIQQWVLHWWIVAIRNGYTIHGPTTLLLRCYTNTCSKVNIPPALVRGKSHIRFIDAMAAVTVRMVNLFLLPKQSSRIHHFPRLWSGLMMSIHIITLWLCQVTPQFTPK